MSNLLHSRHDQTAIWPPSPPNPLRKKLTPSIDSKCFYIWGFMYSFTSFHWVETVCKRVCTENTKILKKPSHNPVEKRTSLLQKIARTSFFLAIVLAILYSTSLRERHLSAVLVTNDERSLLNLTRMSKIGKLR